MWLMTFDTLPLDDQSTLRGNKERTVRLPSFRAEMHHMRFDGGCSWVWQRFLTSDRSQKRAHYVWILCMTLFSSPLVNMRQHSSICIALHRWVSFAWCTTSGCDTSGYSQRLIGIKHKYKPCAVFQHHCNPPVSSQGSLTCENVKALLYSHGPPLLLLYGQ